MTGMKTVMAAFAAPMIPYGRVVARALAFSAEAEFRAALLAVRQSLPVWLRQINREPAYAAALAEFFAESLVAGLTHDGPVQAGLAEILERSRSRKLLPTSLSSRELLEEYGPDVLAQSLFSARTTNAVYLGEMASVIDDYLAGTINTATARMRLVKKLDELGYDPAKGFPGDDTTGIPPAERGSLTDLSSDRRIELILQTQAELAFGLGQQRAGMETLDTLPGWELIRISPRKRVRNWPERFRAAGGEIREGRMIAHKLSGVWPALGSRALFDDALDTDHSPFAWGSGMGLASVDTATMITLGVPFEDGDKPAPSAEGTKPLVSAKLPEGLPADIAAILAAELAAATAEADALFRRDVAESIRRAGE